jgi:hypothetical protein
VDTSLYSVQRYCKSSTSASSEKNGRSNSVHRARQEYFKRMSAWSRFCELKAVRKIHFVMVSIELFATKRSLMKRDSFASLRTNLLEYQLRGSGHVHFNPRKQLRELGRMSPALYLRITKGSRNRVSQNLGCFIC